MERVAGKVTKIDDFFGRKSKSSKGKTLATLQSRYKTNRQTPTGHTVGWTALCLLCNMAIQMHRIKIFVIYSAVRFLIQSGGRPCTIFSLSLVSPRNWQG